MKKSLILFLTLLSGSVFAHDGFYAGVQGGLVYNGLDASNNYSLGQTLANKNNQLAGRLFVGYDLNKYLALEAGYLLTTNLTIQDVEQNQAVGEFKVKEQIADVLAKGRFYAGDRLFIFGEAGLAYVNVKEAEKPLNKGVKNGTNSDINGVYGAGFGYDINDSWSAEAVYTRYCGNRNASSDMIGGKWRPNLGFYSVSISYKF